MFPPTGQTPGNGFTDAKDGWRVSGNAIVANQGRYWIQAAIDLQYGKSHDHADTSGYPTAIDALVNLASLPDTNVTPTQRQQAAADSAELDSFFGTPGLFGGEVGAGDAEQFENPYGATVSGVRFQMASASGCDANHMHIQRLASHRSVERSVPEASCVSARQPAGPGWAGPVSFHRRRCQVCQLVHPRRDGAAVDAGVARHADRHVLVDLLRLVARGI